MLQGHMLMLHAGIVWCLSFCSWQQGLQGSIGAAAAASDSPTAVLQAVFCSSKLIDALITFGAQNYLEFNLLQGRQASYLAARLNAAVIACFLHSTCMTRLGFSLTKPLQLCPCWASGRDTAASRALCRAGSSSLPVSNIRQGDCCKQQCARQKGPA